MGRLLCIGLVVCISVVAFMVGDVAAQSKVIVVGPDEDIKTIKDALNLADPGDTILVKDGTYDEGVIEIRKSVTIKAENQHGAVINGGFHIAANDITIEGVALRGLMGDWRSTGILLEQGTGIVIRGVDIEGPGKQPAGGKPQYGIITVFGKNVEATIEGNTMRNLRYGVYANPPAKLRILDNTFDVAQAVTNDSHAGLDVRGNKIEASVGMGNSGDNLTFYNDQTINLSREDGNSAWIAAKSGGSNLRIENAEGGLVKVTAPAGRAYAIGTKGADNTIVNAGKIEVTGQRAAGIDAEGNNGSITITETGSINIVATGEVADQIEAVGIRVEGDGEWTIKQAGLLTVTAEAANSEAVGVLVVSSGSEALDLTVDSTGDITVSAGNTAFGIAYGLDPTSISAGFAGAAAPAVDRLSVTLSSPG